MIFQSWLTQLCRMIPNIQSALVFDTQDIPEGASPIARWPDAELDVSHVSQVSALLKVQVGPVIILGESNSKPQSATEQATSDSLVIAYPIQLTGFTGVVILQLSSKHSQQNLILQLLKWGKDWLALLLESESQIEKLAMGQSHLRSHGTNNHSSEPLKRYLSIIQLILKCETQYEANLSLVSEIANAYQFRRVWLGECQGDKVEPKVLSNTASFDARTNLVQNIRLIMCEANTFTKVQVYTKENVAKTTIKVQDAINQLLTISEQRSLLCFPLCLNNKAIRVLLCESKTHVSQKTLDEITLLLSLVAPILALKQQANETISQRVKGRVTKGYY